MNQTERSTCDICGRDTVGLKGSTTLDLWIFTTRYDNTGEVRDTMEPCAVDDDYLVIGECCQDRVYKAWGDLIEQLGIQRSKT